MSKFSHDAHVAELRQQMSTLNKPWYRSCTRVLEENNLRGLRCLDLCCGNGEYAHILRDDFDMEVVCADYVPFHLNHLKERGFATLKVDIDAEEQIVLKAIQEYRNSIDLVVSLATVEHVFSSDNLMRIAHNVLKPEGLFIINTPNISYLAYRIYSLLNGNRPFGEGHHIRFWDYRFLRTCLFFNGFEAIGDYREFFSLPQEVLQRAFRNRIFISKLISRLFYLFFLIQHIPFCKGWSTEELTVLCRKQEVQPVPFEYATVKRILDGVDSDSNLSPAAVLERLQDAQQRGWLKEHIYFTALARAYSK